MDGFRRGGRWLPRRQAAQPAHGRRPATAVAVLLLGSGLFAAGCRAHPPDAGATDVVARVDGTPITAAELDSTVASELSQLESQIYVTRRRQLDVLLADRMLTAEAERRGVPLVDLLQEVTSAAAVSDADVEAALRAAGGNGQPVPRENREAVRAHLLARKQAQLRQQFVDGLRAAADITLDLPLPPPYRLTVPVDGAVATRGPAEAPVTIVEFTDFHCPFCRAVQPTLREIAARYGDRVRFVHRDLPVDSLHPRARAVHEAARCAAAQDRFWEFRDRTFEGFPASYATLSDVAAAIELDAVAFETCRADPAIAEAVSRDVDLAATLGVESTPTFFVNQRQIVGAQPLEYFVEFIEAELRHAGGTRLEGPGGSKK